MGPPVYRTRTRLLQVQRVPLDAIGPAASMPTRAGSRAWLCVVGRALAILGQHVTASAWLGQHATSAGTSDDITMSTIEQPWPIPG